MAGVRAGRGFRARPDDVRARHRRLRHRRPVRRGYRQRHGGPVAQGVGQHPRVHHARRSRPRRHRGRPRLGGDHLGLARDPSGRFDLPSPRPLHDRLCPARRPLAGRPHALHPHPTTLKEKRMHIGVCIFATEYAIRIDELAREAEARGFESLWVPEHTHIPTSRRSPFAGGQLPEEYKHTLDPFVSRMAAAAATTKLRIGTGICLIIERDTITTAKSVATLDLLSNGRFEFGIGGGWNAEEMEHHGTIFKSRFQRLREQVLAMKELWTKDVAEYHGDFVNFDPSWSWPKPAQKPHPPVLLGGESSYTLQRVVDFCDGWFPRARNAERVISGLAELKERAAKAGRDMKTITTSVFGAAPDPATLDTWAAGGITRAILRLPPEGRDKVLPLLDQWAKLVKR